MKQITPNTAKIRKFLRTLSLTTAHARDIKNNIICHLLAYEKSVRDGEYSLNRLCSAVGGIGWLLSHIVQIDDKQVLPSQRLALAQYYQAVFEFCENQKSV